MDESYAHLLTNVDKDKSGGHHFEGEEEGERK
jgi:hypothetical protein